MQSLRTDLHRAHIALDNLSPGSRVSDRYGCQWTLDRHGIYWESNDGEIRPSFELAQLAPIKGTNPNKEN